MQNVIFMNGNLGKDPEIRVAGEHKIITFSLAERAGKDKTVWHDCQAWNATGENIAKFFKKGDKIIIQGALEYSEYEKDGNKIKRAVINVRAFDFAGGAKKEEPTPKTAFREADDITKKLQDNFDADEVPF